MIEEKYWLGDLPDKCDLCSRTFGMIMFDANTTKGWGNVCRNCFAMYGRGLGSGKGQKYKLQPSGKWLKTAG